MSACLLDVNVGLAAAVAAHPAHQEARALVRCATAMHPVLWCRATEQSFLRLASTPVITRAYGVSKATNRDAWAALQAFQALDQVDVLAEPPELWGRWMTLGVCDQAAPKGWMDAYLAAFAIAAGCGFATLDQDFLQYEAAGLQLQLLQA